MSSKSAEELRAELKAAEIAEVQAEEAKRIAEAEHKRAESIKADHDLIKPVADKLFEVLTDAAPDYLEVTMSDYDFTGSQRLRTRRFIIWVKGIGFHYSATLEIDPHRASSYGRRYHTRRTEKVNVKVSGGAVETRNWNPKVWKEEHFTRAVDHVIPPAKRIRKNDLYKTESTRIAADTMILFKELWDKTGEDWDPSWSYDNARQAVTKDLGAVDGPERKDGNEARKIHKRDKLEARCHEDRVQVTITFTIDPRDEEDARRFLTLVQNAKAGRIGREDKIDEDGLSIGKYDHVW